MWIGDFFIGHDINLYCVKFHCGSKISWIGLIYFILFLGAACWGIALTSPDMAQTSSEGTGLALNSESTQFFPWFICIAIIRVFDCIYCIYTGCRRHIDPRKRLPFLVISMIARILSAIGGLGAVIMGIIMLVNTSSFPDSSVEIAFYLSFIPLCAIYLIISYLFLSPCGWCTILLCQFCLCETSCLDNDNDNELYADWNRWLTCLNNCTCCTYCTCCQRNRANIDSLPQHRSRSQSQSQSQPSMERPQRVAPEAPQENSESIGEYEYSETSQQKRYEKNTKRFNFRDLLGIDDMYECSICLEEYKADDVLRKLPCDHRYHEHCITKYVTMGNLNCPLCRQPISRKTTSLFNV